MAAISSIPTLMLFRDGVLLFNQAGALPPQALTDVIKQARELDMDAVRQEMQAAQEAAANGPQDAGAAAGLGRAPAARGLVG